MDHKQHPSPEQCVEFDDVSFSHRDIFTVVNLFYGKVQKDEILATPFKSVDNWETHIENLTNFWWIKLGGKSYLNYKYNPIVKHYEAGFDQLFLDRWISIFKETLMENLHEKQYEVWLAMAKRTGRHLTERDQVFRQKIGKNIVHEKTKLK